MNQTQPDTRKLTWPGPWPTTGWLLLVLGVGGLLGWLLAIRVLVQPFADRAPIRPLAAFGLVALGLGALAVDRGRRRLAIGCGVVVLALGYASLLSLTTGLSLGIDRIPFRRGLALHLNSATPDGLAVSTAIGLLLAGAALALIAARFRSGRIGAFLVGVLGATLVALNLAVILSHLLGYAPGIQFARLTGSAVQVSLGLLAFGLVSASWAWSRDWSPAVWPAWVPVAAGLASLVAVLFIWRALVQGQRDEQTALLSAMARGTQDRVTEAMSRTNVALWRVAWLSSRSTVGSVPWTSQVRNVLDDTPGLDRVAWVPKSGRPVIFPPSPDSAVLRVQLGIQLPPSAIPSVTAFDSLRNFSLADSTPTIAIAIPRCDLEACDGFVVALLRVDAMLRPVLGDSVDGFHREVGWRGQTLFGPSPPPNDGREEGVYRSILPFNDMTWEMAVWPTRELRSRMQAGLPNLVLAVGLLVTALLPVTLQLSRTLKANARTAEQVRLQLALGRSMDRAWSWDLPGPEPIAPAVRSNGTGQEVRDGRWTELIHPEDRARVEALLEAHLGGRTLAFEAQYRIRTGPGVWHWRVDRGHVSARALDDSPVQMLGVSGDVSERQRVEEERESSERRFRAVFDGSYQLQALLDLDGRVLDANPTALNLLGPGTAIEDLNGTDFWEAPWWPTPQVRERIQAAAVSARAGQTVDDEVEIQNAAGDRLILDISHRPIRDARGEVVQLVAEGRDITAARRAEAQLREVETLSTMGRLAARVAHEINNPLAGIQNSFLLLRDAIPTTHPHYPYVGAMEREIGRIASVTRQLYETYRPEANGSGRAGVRTLIGDAVALLEQVNRPSKVRIHADLDSVPSQVPVPESVLRQSVYNLVQNAVEASPPGGTVTVRAAVIDATFVLRVRDEGPGVPAEMRARIFLPFPEGADKNAPARGMGIGLSLVHRSVRALGGSIEIADPPEGGTEFVVRIPFSPSMKGGAA